VSTATHAVGGVPHIETTKTTPRGGRRARVGLSVVALAAFGLWRWSLLDVHPYHLGEYGLPAALPPIWYLALAASVLGAVAAITAGRGHPLLAILFVCLTAVILFGTVPALSPQPHYAWTYKHIGVVRYLEAHGQVNTSIDIYNRWPGFFSLAAAFSALTGARDPASYAAWADLFFLIAAAAMVIAAVKVVVGEWRVAMGAGLLFVLSNWVGQTYFSPQAFGYVLGLAMLVVILDQLRTERLARRIGRLIAWVARAPQLPVEAGARPRWPRGAAVAAVILLDAVTIATHQLTPYMLLVGIAVLVVIGVVRPWWLLAVMTAMTLGYLAANFHFIQHNYGLFTSIDPFNNVQGPKITQHPSPGKVFNTDAQLLLIAIVFLLVFGAIARLARRGLLVRALPFVVLAFSPAAIVFGQNYGGEASLRVILFSSPWCAALIAWALSTLPRSGHRAAGLAIVAVVFAPLFVVSYLGQEELNIISPAEVRASAWFYAHAPHGSVLVLAAPGFPYRYGASYPAFRGPEGDANPNLMTEPAFQGRALGAAQVPGVAARIRDYSSRGYIAFSRDETAYAEVFRITPPGALEQLRRAVAASPMFRPWFHNRDVDIYEMVPGAR
jgi:hypothetical protein